MQSLSFTQEFVLCALTRKGGVPDRVGLEANLFHACVFAAGIVELLDAGYVVRQEKGKLAAGVPWDGALPYLAPLHHVIVSSKKPRTARKFAEEHLLNSTRLPKRLFASFGESLVAAGCAERTFKDGVFGRKTRYVPRPEAVARVIGKVRAEVLEEGGPADGTICLVALLDKSRLIRDYFTKVERRVLKDRLKQARAREEYAAVGDLVKHINSMIELTNSVIMGAMVIATTSS
jgi:hypothetical protein